MNIGFVGLGKLGLPCALAIENAGHDVVGYDPSPDVYQSIANRKIRYDEVGAQELLEKSKIRLITLFEVVDRSDIIFVPVQTPHQPDYEGTTRMPDERVDFYYGFLRQAMSDIATAVRDCGKRRTVVIISTVLPGTIDRVVRPVICTSPIDLCYNPYFIAMGTTIRDFTSPEFVLLGHDEDHAWVADMVESFYRTIHDRKVYRTDIRTAELIKVAYNTFISTKICFANAMMEICHKMGCNVNDVSDALSLATDRIISPRYMRAGMGDGGGCHPRDNIAMSYLAKRLNLSCDIFESVMHCRERQTEWLADVICDISAMHPLLGVCLLGKSFKPETNITTGSPALLLANILIERGVEFLHEDLVSEGRLFDPSEWPARLYFIATQHSHYRSVRFPPGSVVIDPFGYIHDQPSVIVVRVGRP